MIGNQDPYVKLTNLDNEETAKCKPVKNGGTSITWDVDKHKSKLSMSVEKGYHSKADIKVEIFDAETVGSDRIIAGGRSTINIADYVLFKPFGPTEDIVISLLDPDRKPSGEVELTIQFINEAYDSEKEIAHLTRAPTKSIAATSGGSFSTSIKELNTIAQDPDLLTETAIGLLHIVEGKVHKNEIISMIEEKTGIPKNYLAGSGGSIFSFGFLFLWINLG